MMPLISSYLRQLDTIMNKYTYIIVLEIRVHVINTCNTVIYIPLILRELCNMQRERKISSRKEGSKVKPDEGDGTVPGVFVPSLMKNRY